MLNWKLLALGLGLTLLCPGWGRAAAPPASQAGSKSPMQWKRAKTVDSSIVKRFCRTDGPVRFSVVIFKDRAGEIGGYQVSSSVMDAPVDYFDSQGTHLTMFHIFGDASERTAAMRVIKALKAEFPVEEPLRCAGR